jgi:hypothetical protein
MPDRALGGTTAGQPFVIIAVRGKTRLGNYTPCRYSDRYRQRTFSAGEKLAAGVGANIPVYRVVSEAADRNVCPTSQAFFVANRPGRMYKGFCKRYVDLTGGVPPLAARKASTCGEITMAKPSPPASRPRPAPDRTPAREERTGPALSPLQIRYYRRMHLQHVYPVTVSWYERDERRPPGTAPPVLVRLLMAGAQVVPSEQPLDPARRDAQVTFYVTPLARGWLRGERLEVLVGGRKVQELPLSTHVTSQKMTWFLLIMTILVPWFLLTYCSGPPVLDDPVNARMVKLGRENKRLLRSRGWFLEEEIKKHVPDVPEVVNENLPFVGDSLLAARRFVANIYDALVQQSSQRPVAFYAGTGLLFLTALSWWVHRAKRRRIISTPIPIPTGAAVPLAAGE